MQLDGIPPELEMFSRVVDGQPPNVRELFQYALTVLMVEDGKAEVTERHTIDLREQLTLNTSAADVFTIAKPACQEVMARDILLEDQGNGEVKGE